MGLRALWIRRLRGMQCKQCKQGMQSMRVFRVVCGLRALGLAAILCFAVLACPKAAAAAPGAITLYQPKKLEMGVLNQAMFKNADAYNAFYAKYVTAQSAFNQIDRFGPIQLLYGGSYIRPNYNLSLEMGTFDSLPVMDTLRVKDDLQMLLRATVHSVMHYGPTHKNTEVLAFTAIRLLQGVTGEDVLAERFCMDRVTAATAVGDNIWFKPRAKTPYTGTTFRLQVRTGNTLYGGTCNCGDARISNIAVAFADVVPPKLQKVTVTSDPEGKNPKTAFGEGDTLYIHLYFDEFVRLSDNSPLHDDAKLYLDVFDAGEQQVTGSSVVASLYSLTGNRVTFAYTVTDSITVGGSQSVPTNHYIGGISRDQPSLLTGLTGPTGPGGSNKFALAILDNNGNTVALPASLQQYSELTETTSLITDLAGNPVSSLSYALSQADRCKIDSVDPIVEKVDVAHDPSVRVFAGPGQRLVFSATFSEPLNIDLAKNPAALNGVAGTVNLIRRSDGAAIAVEAQSISDDRRTLTFKPLTITADMKPASTQIGGAQVAYATLTSIVFPGGVTDLCGNPYGGTVDKAARSQYYVDTLAPTASADPNLTVDGGRYVPAPPTQGTSGFRFSFVMADSSADGAVYSSGLAPRGQYAGPVGGFSWVNPTPGVGQNRFEWAVTASPETPVIGWAPGVTQTTTKEERYPFPEIEGGNLQYLHIRLIDSEQYNIADSSIVIYPKDFSGNEGRVEFPLKYVADVVGPAYERTGQKSQYDAATLTGRVTACVTVADPSKVDPSTIRYQWVPDAGTPPDPGSPAGWVSYTLSGGAATAFDLSIDSADLPSGSTYTLYLYVTSKDLLGNQSMSPAFRFDLDLACPAYGVEVSQGVSADPALVLTPPNRHPSTGAPSTMVVMIKDPLGPTGQEYFVRTMNSEGWGTAGDVLSGLIWTTDPSDYQSAPLHDTLSAWRYVKLVRNGDFTKHNGEIVSNVQFGFANAVGGVNAIGDNLFDVYMMPSTEAWIATAQRLMAIVGGKYYGDIQVTVITGYGATGPAVWERDADHTADGEVYKVNAKNNGTFVNDAAYYWNPPSGDPYLNKEGYYYDRDLTQKVSLSWAVFPDDRASAGYFVSYIPQGAVVDVQTWTLRAASGSVVLVQPNSAYNYAPTGRNSGYGEWASPTYSLPSVCAVTVQPVRKDLLAGVSGWNDPDDGARYVDSIDGEEVRVSLEDLIAPSWGVADIDFSSQETYLSVELMSSPDVGAPAPGTEVYRTALKPEAMQTVTLPGITACSGRYKIKVQAKAKASDVVSRGSYDQVYVDRAGIAEFGLAKTASTAVCDAAGGTVERTTVAWYGYDSQSKPTAEYEHPDLRLGDAVGGNVLSLSHSLYFTAKSAGFDVGGARYGDLFIKVWNASDGLSQAEIDAGRIAAKWVPLSTKCDLGLRTVVVGDKAGLAANYVDPLGAPLVPLLHGTENILNYQVASSSGKTSDIRTLFVTVTDEKAEFEVAIDPQSSDKVLDHTTASVTKLKSQTFDSLSAYYWDGAQAVPVSESIKLTRSGTHAFFATNAFGNYTFLEKYVDFVDGTAPTISDAFSGMFNDHFELKYIISDNYLPGGKLPKGFSLYLRFDDAYNQALGYDPGQFVRIDLPDYTGDVSGRTKTATGPSGAGIYEVTASPVAGGSEVLIVLKGVFKYDPAGGPTASHSVYVYARDVAGNNSNVVSDSAQMDNIRPRVTGVQKSTYTDWDFGGFTFIDVNARFSVPVLLNSPAEEGAAPQFSREKHHLPIYADVSGYEFGFTDIFGDYYSPGSASAHHIDPVNISCLGDFSLSVAYSTTEPTSDAVTVDLSRVSDKLTFSAWQGGEQFAFSTDRVNRTLTENDTIYCSLVVGGVSQWVRIPVTNIYKSPPTASVTWYYSEFGSNTLPPGVAETTGEVTAYLTSTCGRSIYPINGTTNSHTFVSGDTTSSSYTFEFADAAQNAGAPITAHLLVNIVAPPPPPSDVDAPEYHLRIMAKHNGVYRLMGTWSNEQGWTGAYPTFPDALSGISWTSGYLLDFDLIEDASPTRLLLLSPGAGLGNLDYDASASEDIAGVALSGRSVVVSQNASFIVAIIDSSNNKTVLSVDASLIDTEAPTITIEKVKTGFYKVRLYVGVSDAVSPATLVSPAGAPRLADGTSKYNGWYYFDFDANGGLQLTAEDAARNRATAMASVDDIDASAPVSTVLWWSPCFEGDQSQPPTGILNKDVSVGLGFDRTIESVKVSVRASKQDVPDASVGDYVRMELQGDKAILTFLKQADSVKIEYTGQNRKTGSRTFLYGMDYFFTIDKTPPVISVSDLTGLDVATARSVTVTFTVGGEPVITETGQVLNAGATITRTITSRGTFTYRFSDLAGNVTEKTVEVKNIDVEPPVIMVMGEDNGGACKRGTHTFYATLSEQGKILFGGSWQDVAAPIDRDSDGKFDLDYLESDPAKRECDWKALTVAQNGTYQIVAEDVSGRKSSTYVTISCLDNSPPSIAFSPPATLSVRQGTTLADFQDMFQSAGAVLGDGLKGVVVSDNVSSPEHIQLSVDLAGWDQARLDGTGTESVKYTATDEAGNSRTVARSVRIYPKDELIVTVNGQKTEESSTTVFVGETRFTVSIENLPGGQGEPVKIYLLAGRHTAGQMKSLSKEVGREFTVAGKGYYTLYVVPQSRQAYLTYLYIQ